MASTNRNENGIGIIIKHEENGDKNGIEKSSVGAKTGPQNAPEGTRQNRYNPD